MNRGETRYVAVYGTLRKGNVNHFLIENSKFIGQFNSSKSYIMMYIPELNFPNITTEEMLTESVKNEFIENGIIPTPIKFEVYEVSLREWRDLCNLERFSGNNDNPNNLYLVLDIETPFGSACYFGLKNFMKGEYVVSGDFSDFVKK